MALPLKDVHVTIDLKKPLQLLGFGKPLILGIKEETGADLKEYFDLDSVKTDYAETTNEYKMAKAIFAQNNAPKSIVIACGTDATSLDETLEEIYYNDFYFVLCTDNTKTTVTAIADKVEELGNKMFVTRSSSDTELAAYVAKKYERTIVFYTTEANLTAGELPDAALVGECGSQPVGSITWKFKTLKGITPLELSLTELNAIHRNGAITYVTKAGDDITSEGKVVSGEYIDIIHSKDYIINNIEYMVQKLLNSSPKIPYTNAGIAQIESANKVVLQAAYTNGMISDTDGKPDYSTAYGKAEEASEEDRVNREYKLGTFQFKLAGSIHETWIHGTITF